jgi:hypothetical protein
MLDGNDDKSSGLSFLLFWVAELITVTGAWWVSKLPTTDTDTTNSGLLEVEQKWSTGTIRTTSNAKIFFRDCSWGRLMQLLLIRKGRERLLLARAAEVGEVIVKQSFPWSQQTRSV